MSRAEPAAATRRALLAEAALLLDGGGPDAVTLREVGARAGVSRGGPYRHFDGKDSLLIAVAAVGWERLGDEVLALQDDSRARPLDALRAALVAILAVGHRQPYLYRLMFDTPVGDRSAVNQAAQRLCDTAPPAWSPADSCRPTSGRRPPTNSSRTSSARSNGPPADADLRSTGRWIPLRRRPLRSSRPHGRGSGS